MWAFVFVHGISSKFKFLPISYIYGELWCNLLWILFWVSLVYSSPDHCSLSPLWLCVVQYKIIIKEYKYHVITSKIYLFDQLIWVWWFNFLTKMLEVKGIWFSHFGHWIFYDLYFNITYKILKTHNWIANQRHQHNQRHQYIWLIH